MRLGIWCFRSEAVARFSGEEWMTRSVRCRNRRVMMALKYGTQLLVLQTGRLKL